MKLKLKYQEISASKRKKTVHQFEGKRNAVYGNKLGLYMFEDQEKVMKEAKIISTLEEDAMYK